MFNKPLNISESAAVQMPMKTVASLICLVAIGTWAFFSILTEIYMGEKKILKIITK